MPSRRIFCHRELDKFPESEFRHSEDGSLLQPYIHEPPSAKPHWAATGLPLGSPRKMSSRKRMMVGKTTFFRGHDMAPRKKRKQDLPRRSLRSPSIKSRRVKKKK